MSRVGKNPIKIPEKVTVEINGRKVKVKGPKGELFQELPPLVSLVQKEQHLQVSVPDSQIKSNRALWGLTRVLVANMIEGVINGFEKKLEIKGVGYRAALEENELVLSVGFSHLVRFKIPENIEVKVVKNIITVSGIDKQLVGEVASKIRDIKKPEPYKGKGIRYMNEYVIRKVGKAVKTGSTQ